MRPRVLVVDDHAGFRAAARALLQAEGFDVVGEAVDGASAISTAARLRPDVVLLDIQLPDLDGFTVCERIVSELAREDGGAPAIVLTSSRDASSFRRRLAESRARGFIPKDELSGAAVRAVVDTGR